MPHEHRLWDRLSPPGFALAAGYAALLVASFAKSIQDNRSYNGIYDISYDWVFFYLLTMPWSDLIRVDPDVRGALIVYWMGLLGGVVINTAAIYIIGSLMQPMWVQFMNWHENRDH